MQKLFAKLLVGSKDKKKTSELLFDDEITRYPPFAKGFPVVPVEVLLKGQSKLIAEIKSTLRFSAEEFDVLVMPVIEKYAEFVHLLPASEAHHHRGSGGLFRHGLEVGRYAAQFAEAYQFCVGETPMNKREKEPRWQLAAFLGGLLHDLGKPFHDVAVVNKEGNEVWNAQKESLLDWAENKNVKRYFIRWRDKRKKRHKSFSPYNLSMVITKEAAGYLNDPDPEIMAALIESVQGVLAGHELTNIVIQSDQESIKVDMKPSKELPDETAFGVPIETYIFNSIRRTIGTRKINEKGGLIWLVDQGVFVNWKKILPEINNILDADQIAGIPRNPDILADILIERGFAIPYQKDPESRPERYWSIYPEILKGIHQECIKLDNPGRLFISELPVVIKASMTKPTIEDVEKTSSELEETKLVGKRKEDEEVKPEDENNIVGKRVKIDGEWVDSTTGEIALETVYKDDDEIIPVGGDGEGWAIINNAITLTRKGKDVVEKLAGGEYAITFPTGAAKLGSPKEIMNILSVEGLIIKDPLTKSKTSVISGIKYLVISENLKKYIAFYLATDRRGQDKPIPIAKNNEISPSEVITQLIEQAEKGYGGYIFGDVDVREEDNHKVYLVNDECIRLIEEKTGLGELSFQLGAKNCNDEVVHEGAKGVVKIKVIK